jgi:hypothetical protein
MRSILLITTTDHKEVEQLKDQRNVAESSCNFGDGKDQRVQSLMFMMMMMIMTRKKLAEKVNLQNSSDSFLSVGIA